ncbi:MAG: peptidoglycan-binding protein, partial [bacterium]|nr:peptidoglycan-binding protein [bacterium]
PTEGTPAGGNAPAGFSVGSTVISIGSDAGTLTFDTPVTIILSGVTGTVGYRPAGSDVWQTITTCAGTYDIPTLPTAPGECAINNGTNTKIVTYHFTSFGGLDPIPSTPAPTPVSSGGGGGIFYSYGFKINDGAIATSNTSVSLSITSAGSANQMWVSNDSAFSTGSWVPFQATFPWTLTAGPGTKTVYLRYGSSNSVVASVQVSIKLDSPVIAAAQVQSSTQGEVLGASVVACPVFTQNLFIGSMGAEVTALQKRLNSDGVYSGPITGYFGNLTREGVLAFQKKNNIDQVGVVGPKTREILNICSGGTNTQSASTVLGESTFKFTRNLGLGMKDSDVSELQNRLTKDGIYFGPVTGYFGPLTLAAVKAYQAAHPAIGYVTGFVGPLTRAELNK